MKALARRRRHPIAGVLILLLGLLITGAAYAVAAPRSDVSTEGLTGDKGNGEKLFLANCSTCHGLGATGTKAGPSLVGVGAASVDFQVGTGRMPMEATAPQAPRKQVHMTAQEIADLSAYVASLGPGPGIPDKEYTTPDTEDEKLLAEGAELFRVNCAMCHNVVGSGGALTRGKWAPKLSGVSGEHIYGAMVTGPQSMPVFNDANITPEGKKAIISYLAYVQEQPSPGGNKLGALGPVSEGLFAWVGMLLMIIGCTVWLGAKSS